MLEIFVVASRDFFFCFFSIQDECIFSKPAGWNKFPLIFVFGMFSLMQHLLCFSMSSSLSVAAQTMSAAYQRPLYDLEAWQASLMQVRADCRMGVTEMRRWGGWVQTEEMRKREEGQIMGTDQIRRAEYFCFNISNSFHPREFQSKLRGPVSTRVFYHVF